MPWGHGARSSRAGERAARLPEKEEAAPKASRVLFQHPPPNGRVMGVMEKHQTIHHIEADTTVRLKAE